MQRLKRRRGKRGGKKKHHPERGGLVSFADATIKLRARLGRPFAVDEVKALVEAGTLIARTLTLNKPAGVFAPLWQIARLEYAALVAAGLVRPIEERSQPDEQLVTVASIESYAAKELGQRLPEPDEDDDD